MLIQSNWFRICLVAVNHVAFVTHLAALFCTTCKALMRYPSLAPQRGMRYVRTDMNTELAAMSLVLKGALTANFFRAFNRLVNCLIRDYSLLSMCSLNFRPWWIWQPRSFSVCEGAMVCCLAISCTWSLRLSTFSFPITTRWVLSALMTSLLLSM